MPVCRPAAVRRRNAWRRFLKIRLHLAAVDNGLWPCDDIEQNPASLFWIGTAFRALHDLANEAHDWLFVAFADSVGDRCKIIDDAFTGVFEIARRGAGAQSKLLKQ